MDMAPREHLVRSRMGSAVPIINMRQGRRVDASGGRGVREYAGKSQRRSGRAGASGGRLQESPRGDQLPCYNILEVYSGLEHEEDMLLLRKLHNMRSKVEDFVPTVPERYSVMLSRAADLEEISKIASALWERLGHNYKASATKQCAWRTSATLDAAVMTVGEPEASRQAIFLPKTFLGEAWISAVAAACIHLSLMMHAVFDTRRGRTPDVCAMGLANGEQVVELLEGVLERRRRALDANPEADVGTGWYAEDWKRCIGELSVDVLSSMLHLAAALSELLSVPQVHADDICYEGLTLDQSTTVLALVQEAERLVGPSRAPPSPYSSFLRAFVLCMRNRRLADTTGLARLYQQRNAVATVDMERSLYYAELMRGTAIAAAMAYQMARNVVAFEHAEDMLSVIYVATDELLGTIHNAQRIKARMVREEVTREESKRGLFMVTMLILGSFIIDAERLCAVHCAQKEADRIADDEEIRNAIRGAPATKGLFSTVTSMGAMPAADVV